MPYRSAAPHSRCCRDGCTPWLCTAPLTQPLLLPKPQPSLHSRTVGSDGDAALLTWQHVAGQGRTEERAAHVVKPSLNPTQFNPVCSDCFPELFVLLGSNNLKAQMVPGRKQSKLYLSRTENSYVEVFCYLFGFFSHQYHWIWGCFDLR